MTDKKARILVVEDDEAIMLGLEENLKVAGYDVITADGRAPGAQDGAGSPIRT